MGRPKTERISYEFVVCLYPHKVQTGCSGHTSQLTGLSVYVLFSILFVGWFGFLFCCCWLVTFLGVGDWGL